MPPLILVPVPQVQGKKLVVDQATKGYSYPKPLRWASIVLGKADFPNCSTEGCLGG